METEEKQQSASPADFSEPRESDDVQVVRVGDREFVLVGTAHVSRESADLVRRVIEVEQPDRVCIELDAQRYKALSEKTRFESLDIKEIIRSKQLGTLMFNLMLSSYQKQLGLQLGVQPGTELLEAAQVAEANGIPVSLCDRDVRVTLRRAWAALSLWRKSELGAAMVASLFDSPELGEDDLRELRQQDMVTKLMEELGEAFPQLKRVLIDERDAYLSAKIAASEGKKVVAVVGAGHVGGIRSTLEESRPVDTPALEVIPPVSPLWKLAGWSIPAVIVGAILWIGLRQGADAAAANVLIWILANGIPAMIGAFAALAHPATALIVFVAAPITSLTPVIGAGYVAAFAQTYFRPPLVRELASVASEVRIPARWWSNRLLRIFLVFLFTTLGSLIGTFVGGAEILGNLF
jgi:pheromone shutdown-related protein TraB